VHEEEAGTKALASTERPGTATTSAVATDDMTPTNHDRRDNSTDRSLALTFAAVAFFRVNYSGKTVGRVRLPLGLVT